MMNNDELMNEDENQDSNEEIDDNNSLKRTKKPKRGFPRATLEDCLIIAHEIKDKNGGNSWNPELLAKACGEESNKTRKFQKYSQASKEYGITEGVYSSSNISITDFGRKLLYASSQLEERKRKIEAFLNVELFKNVLEHYKKPDLPEMKYLSNILETQFNLHRDYHNEFSEIFQKNCKQLEITNDKPLENIQNYKKTIKDKPLEENIEISSDVKKKILFVIMPFNEEKSTNRQKGFFQEVLEQLIKPAGLKAGFDVKTANKQGSELIHHTIINELLDADLVLADLTDHNPNVLFELGIRMAKDKPVTLIKSKDTGRIFDVDNIMRVFEYCENLWPSTVKNDIVKIEESLNIDWKNRSSDQTYMNILIKGSNNKNTD